MRIWPACARGGAQAGHSFPARRSECPRFALGPSNRPFPVKLPDTVADSIGMAMNRRPQLSIVAPGVSPVEAAAVVAAVERFMRDTAPVIAPAAPRRSAWQQAALREGVTRTAGPLPTRL